MIPKENEPKVDSLARERFQAALGRRILVVDDAHFFRMRLRHLLEQLGYWKIVEAESGKEAISLFRSNRFDLVLLDVALGDTDGISVLRVMRRLDPKARLVVVTAAASEPVVRQAMAAGAKRVYVKPIDEAAFKSEIQRLIEGDGFPP